MRPVLVTKSRVYEPLRYPFRGASAFSPFCTETLLKLLAHDVFNQDPHRAYGKVSHAEAKFLLIGHAVVR